MQPQDPMSVGSAGSDQSGYGQTPQPAPGPDQWFQPQTIQPGWRPGNYSPPSPPAAPVYPVNPIQNYNYNPAPDVTVQAVNFPPNPGVSPAPQVIVMPTAPQQPYVSQPQPQQTSYPQTQQPQPQQPQAYAQPQPIYASPAQQPYYGTPPQQPQAYAAPGQPQYTAPGQQPYAPPDPNQPVYPGNPAAQPYGPYTAPGQPMQQPSSVLFQGAPAPQPNPYGPLGYDASPEHLLASEPTSKKKIVLIIGAALAGLLVLALIGMTLKNVLSSVKLTTFTTPDYSLLVPADYKKIDNGDGFVFQEDDDAASRSEIETYYSKFNPEISAEDVKAIRDTLRNQLQTLASDKAAAGGQTLTGLKVAEFSYKGNDALKLTANITKDNSLKGTMQMIAVVNSKQVYIFGIAAHESDKALAKKEDVIINSFTLK